MCFSRKLSGRVAWLKRPPEADGHTNLDPDAVRIRTPVSRSLRDKDVPNPIPQPGATGFLRNQSALKGANSRCGLGLSMSQLLMMQPYIYLFVMAFILHNPQTELTGKCII